MSNPKQPLVETVYALELKELRHHSRMLGTILEMVLPFRTRQFEHTDVTVARVVLRLRELETENARLRLAALLKEVGDE